MSYCRQPYYIYPNINGTVVFDVFGDIPDEVVNIFLYKIYNFCNDEFIERTELGRKTLNEWESNKEDNSLKSMQNIQNKYIKAYKNIDENILKEMEENMEDN